MEEMFLVVTRSHRHIHSVEDRVAEYLSHGFVNTNSSSHLQEYVSFTENYTDISLRQHSSIRQSIRNL